MVERAAHELAALASAAHRVHHRLEPPAQQRRQRGEAVVGQVRDRGEDKHEADEEEGDRQARWPVSETRLGLDGQRGTAEAQGSLECDLAQTKKAAGEEAAAGLVFRLFPPGRGQYCLGKSTRAEVIREPEPMCAIFLAKTIGIHCRRVSTAKSSSCPTMPARMHRQPIAVCAAGDSACSKGGQEADMLCCCILRQRTTRVACEMNRRPAQRSRSGDDAVAEGR